MLPNALIMLQANVFASLPFYLYISKSPVVSSTVVEQGAWHFLMALCTRKTRDMGNSKKFCTKFSLSVNHSILKRASFFCNKTFLEIRKQKIKKTIEKNKLSTYELCILSQRTVPRLKDKRYLERAIFTLIKEMPYKSCLAFLKDTE